MSQELAARTPSDLTNGLEKDRFESRHLTDWAGKVDTDKRPLLRLAHSLFIIIFVFGGIWAGTAPLGGAIVTQGRVIAEGRNRVIQHFEGGILKELRVKEGDTVKAGEIVAVLDDTAIMAQLRASRLQRAILKVQLSRRRAEVNELEAIEFPDDLEPMVKDHPRVLEAITSQLDEFNAQRKFRQAGNEIIDAQILAQQGDIEGLQEVLVAMDRQLELFELELRDFKDLLSRGAIDRTIVFSTERQVVDLKARIARTKLDIRAAENNIETLSNQKRQEQLAELQDSNRVLVEVQQRLNDVESQVIRLQDMARRTEIRAPEDGTVFLIAKRTLGAVLRSGDPLMEISPKDDVLTIEARLEVRHIEKVHVGQEAAIVFPTNRQKSTVQFPATLTYLSPDTVVTERDPIGAYTIHVTVDNPEGISDLVLGNNAQVFVKTKSQTFFDILAGPITRFGINAFNE